MLEIKFKSKIENIQSPEKIYKPTFKRILNDTTFNRNIHQVS